MAKLDDFLNPNSILTPGIAGGLATTIAIPLATSFGFSIPWLVLGTSFLLSLMIVSGFEARITLPKRALYCVLNTLVIFSTGIGAAHQVDRRPEPPAPPGAVSAAPASGALDFLLPSAQAQTQSRGTPARQPVPQVAPPAPAAREPAVTAPADDKETEVTKLRSQLKELQEYRAKQQEYQRQTEAYDKRWKF